MDFSCVRKLYARKIIYQYLLQSEHKIHMTPRERWRTLALNSLALKLYFLETNSQVFALGEHSEALAYPSVICKGN